MLISLYVNPPSSQIIAKRTMCGRAVENVKFDIYAQFGYKYPHMLKTSAHLSNRKRKRTHGFIKRRRTAGGRNTLKRRRRKGRRKIAV